MFQLIRKKLELVTPELAGKFLDANIYEGQRPLRPQHVEVLKNAIESGVFLTGSIAIAKQRWGGGAAMLANGQHQCEEKGVGVAGRIVVAGKSPDVGIIISRVVVSAGLTPDEGVFVTLSVTIFSIFLCRWEFYGMRCRQEEYGCP